MHNSHKEILILYNSVLRGYLNYYSFVHNYAKISSTIYYILRTSCACLLAAKFSIKYKSKVYNKFGRNLTYKDSNTHECTSFYRPSFKTEPMRFYIKADPVVKNINVPNYSVASIIDLSCSNCGSDHRVEMHPIIKLKNLNPKLSEMDQHQLLASSSTNIRQIPLCRVCHINYHYQFKTKLVKSVTLDNRFYENKDRVKGEPCDMKVSRPVRERVMILIIDCGCYLVHS